MQALHSSAAATYVDANHGCTYGKQNSRWLNQELHRLLSMQRRTGNGLVLTRGEWSWNREPGQYQFRGLMSFFNTSARHELFIPEVSGSVKLLSLGSLASVESNVKIKPRHPGNKPPPRQDEYWCAYITRAGESTCIEVVVDIESADPLLLEKLQAVRVSIEYICYGPHGRTKHGQHVVLPTSYPQKQQQLNCSSSILPVSTHLLCHLDDPLEVLKTYVLPQARPGDIIAIAETPLAIMQGRYRHPGSIVPGLIAKLACRLFHPTSSLATACGMQALIDISGRTRVFFAVIVAVLARLFGIRGMFYRLAGEQARLIDDVTGTLPPYDQFITLGPVNAQETAEALKSKTGFEVAIVDANNLKKVQILAASSGVDCNALAAKLIHNPAGNDDEQTPIVLVRG